jgi:aspartyl-tRNA synthetase
MLDAFEYGAPPHGGIALGLDRIIAILCGASTIRDAIAFPKNQVARDLLMGAPSQVTATQLEELSVRVALPPASL